VAPAVPTACNSYSYDAYGVMLGGNPTATSPAATNYLYTGEQFDEHAQHDYLRARYYNPLNGRFNRMDPYAGSPQDPQSLHKYLYCHANPVNGIDPSGMMEFSLTGTLKSISIGAVISSAIGATIGGLAGGYFHILQNQSFEGIWKSIGLSALYGALLGAILGGLGAISAMALAIGLAAAFAVNVYFTLKILRDPNMREETKAAAVLFLILQAVLSFRAVFRGFSKPSTSPSTTPTASTVETTAKNALASMEPDTAYAGYIDSSGKVGLVKTGPSPGMQGHADFVANGTIPKGSSGFGIVTNQQGEIVVLSGQSGLNGSHTNYALPQSSWQAILSSIKELGIKFSTHASVRNGS